MSERGLDPDSDDTDELKKLIIDAERQSCDEYLACLFIMVADGGRYQGLKRALDNQYLHRNQKVGHIVGYKKNMTNF